MSEVHVLLAGMMDEGSHFFRCQSKRLSGVDVNLVIKKEVTNDSNTHSGCGFIPVSFSITRKETEKESTLRIRLSVMPLELTEEKTNSLGAATARRPGHCEHRGGTLAGSTKR